MNKRDAIATAQHEAILSETSGRRPGGRAAGI